MGKTDLIIVIGCFLVSLASFIFMWNFDLAMAISFGVLFLSLGIFIIFDRGDGSE